MFDDGEADILRTAIDALGTFARTDVAGSDEDHLCEAAVGLERARRFLDAAQCHVLGELEARNVTDRSFGQRTSSWLAHHAGLPSGVARQRVRVAAKLRRLEPLDERLTAGQVGFDHARVLADAASSRIEDEIAQLSGPLCDLAGGMVFDRWRREVDGIAELLDQDGGHDPDRDLERNRLTMGRTGDRTIGSFELIGARGDLVREGINTLADELFARYTRDHEITPELPVPDRATLMGLALEEAVRRSLAIDDTATKAPKVEMNLVLTPDEVHGHPELSSPPALSDRTRLHAAAVGFTLTDADGRRLPGDRYDALLCDASIYPVVVNSLGVPLDMGREIRFANRVQRRAMARRDGGCTFPGCTAPPSWTDAHHQKPWERGGTTDVTALISLCRHHHGVAHRKGWNLEIDPDGWTLWTTPNGHQFWGQRHHQQRAGPLSSAGRSVEPTGGGAPRTRPAPSAAARSR
jgi:hypothetical protein